MVKYIKREFKTAFNKLKYPDSWFWARYTINPYSGCEHSCIYCDARSKRYYLQEQQDFENEIIIKTEIDKKLDNKIRRARKLLLDVIATGGVNDAYQPIEKKIENTRKILSVLANHKFPINIATKSALISRDIDLFKKIAIETWSVIGFSITTINEELAYFLEPYSSSPMERLKAMKIIKQAIPEIQVGTYFMPIIPYLEDDDKNLEDVIKKSKEAGADFLLFSPGLTMRDLQKQFFIKKLKSSKYGEIVKPLLNLYNNQIYPPKDYVRELNAKLITLCKKYNLNTRIKRWIPKDYRKWNYQLSEILLNKEYYDLLKTGNSNRNLLWAGLNLNNLNESILDIYKRGELLKLKYISKDILTLIEPYLAKSIHLKKKSGIDKFL